MYRRSMMFALAGLAAVALFGCAKDGAAADPAASLKSLTVDEVATRIAANDGKTFVYDNNPKASWVNGHVPGAKWLDEDSVTTAVLPAEKAATLIFYCHNET